ERVRERVPAVERVRGRAREIDVGLDVGLRVAAVGGALVVDAGLERVLARDLGDVVYEVVDDELLVGGPEDARAHRAPGGGVGRVGGDAPDAAEGQARDQVPG